jgi:hypothetical protein
MLKHLLASAQGAIFCFVVDSLANFGHLEISLEGNITTTQLSYS